MIERSSTQSARHPANSEIRPNIRRKVLALIKKVDGEIAAERAMLPTNDPYAEARRGRARAISTGNLKRGRPPGAGHGRIGPRLPVA